SAAAPPPAPASSSPTPAPRRWRAPSSSPAGTATAPGPASSPSKAPSTAARWARWRSPTTPPTATPSPRSPAGWSTCPSVTSTPSPPRWPTTPRRGEAGVRPLPPGYLAAARELTTRHGALLILDEVQTGVGRTGRWMAHHHEHIGGGVVPDVVVLAKGLAGGIPIGAVVALGEGPAGLLGPGQHGTTFGGNPVAAAAALATLHVIERDDLLTAVTERGRQLREGVTGLGHPLVAGVRGEGLLLAVTLTRPVSREVAQAALEAGYIVNPVAPDAIRLAPPFILSAEQAAQFVADLPAVLDAGGAA